MNSNEIQFKKGKQTLLNIRQMFEKYQEQSIEDISYTTFTRKIKAYCKKFDYKPDRYKGQKLFTQKEMEIAFVEFNFLENYSTK